MKLSKLTPKKIFTFIGADDFSELLLMISSSIHSSNLCLRSRVDLLLLVLFQHHPESTPLFRIRSPLPGSHPHCGTSHSLRCPLLLLPLRVRHCHCPRRQDWGGSCCTQTQTLCLLHRTSWAHAWVRRTCKNLPRFNWMRSVKAVGEIL